jgi:hypothetical protein
MRGQRGAEAIRKNQVAQWAGRENDVRPKLQAVLIGEGHDRLPGRIKLRDWEGATAQTKGDQKEQDETRRESEEREQLTKSTRVEPNCALMR